LFFSSLVSCLGVGELGNNKMGIQLLLPVFFTGKREPYLFFSYCSIKITLFTLKLGQQISLSFTY
jgi:hypothetical protein